MEEFLPLRKAVQAEQLLLCSQLLQLCRDDVDEVDDVEAVRSGLPVEILCRACTSVENFYGGLSLQNNIMVAMEHA